MGNGACVWEAARLYGERKSHERREYEGGVWPADFADFWQYRGAARVWGVAEPQMAEITGFIRQVVIDGRRLEDVRKDVRSFRAAYQKTRFCSDTGSEAYEYVRLR